MVGNLRPSECFRFPIGSCIHIFLYHDVFYSHTYTGRLKDDVMMFIMTIIIINRQPGTREYRTQPREMIQDQEENIDNDDGDDDGDGDDNHTTIIMVG